MVKTVALPKCHLRSVTGSSKQSPAIVEAATTQAFNVDRIGQSHAVPQAYCISDRVAAPQDSPALLSLRCMSPLLHMGGMQLLLPQEEVQSVSTCQAGGVWQLTGQAFVMGYPALQAASLTVAGSTCWLALLQVLAWPMQRLCRTRCQPCCTLAGGFSICPTVLCCAHRKLLTWPVRGLPMCHLVFCLPDRDRCNL